MLESLLARHNVERSLVVKQDAAQKTANPTGPVVLQIVRTYLPPTENWIYEQVTHIERYRSVFASKALKNVGKFPFHPLYSLSESRLHERLLDREMRKRLGYSPFFSAVAEKENLRIMHAHGGGIATFVAGNAVKLGVPLVVSFYGVDMWKHPLGEPGLRRKYAEVFANASLCLAEGPAAAAQLVRIGCHEDRVAIHRLGVDVGAIRFTPRSIADGSRLRVLMACRFVEKKGIPYAVEGFSRVARDNPRMRLTIVGDSGSSRDKRMKRHIHTVAQKYGVADQISILPFMSRDALGDLAESHQLFLHPSIQAPSGDSEGGHPVVMTMLAASGMPILATRHCDIPQVVEHNHTGWLVAERSADEIEATLREIVRDPSMLSEFGCNARKLVESKYDIRTQRLDDVYDRVLSES